jgi:CheY-like chemotaxis protein
MSLNFNIHWVDDTPEFATPVIRTLKKKYAKREIELSASVVEDGENLEQHIRSSPVDLLVVDFNLDERNGDELILSLRQAGELMEIVFYSQNEDVHTKCPNSQGVYPCTRSHAESTISAAVDRFIERCQNVSVMRGIIISEAIDVENRLTEIVTSLFGDKSILFRERILNKRYLDFEKKRMLLKSVLNDKISDLKRDEATDEAELELLNRASVRLQEMKTEIIDQRNILAHCAKGLNKDGILVLTSLESKETPILFNDDWKNKIREDIKQHSNNLEIIRSHLVDWGMITEKVESGES